MSDPNKPSGRGWESVAALARLDGEFEIVPGERGAQALERIRGVGSLRKRIRRDGSLVCVELNGQPFLRPVGRVPHDHPLIDLLMLASDYLIGDLSLSTTVLQEKLRAIAAIADENMEDPS